MSCVVSIDSSLVGSLEVCGEVGNVGSYVTGLFTDVEPEVLRSVLLKLLSSDGNALDNYGKTNECSEVCACSEFLCDVEGLNGLDGLVKNSNLTALDLLHAGVGLHRTGNGNCHTNLNAELFGVF